MTLYQGYITFVERKLVEDGKWLCKGWWCGKPIYRHMYSEEYKKTRSGLDYYTYSKASNLYDELESEIEEGSWPLMVGTTRLNYIAFERGY